MVMMSHDEIQSKIFYLFFRTFVGQGDCLGGGPCQSLRHVSTFLHRIVSSLSSAVLLNSFEFIYPNKFGISSFHMFLKMSRQNSLIKT